MKRYLILLFVLWFCVGSTACVGYITQTAVDIVETPKTTVTMQDIEKKYGISNSTLYLDGGGVQWIYLGKGRKNSDRPYANEEGYESKSEIIAIFFPITLYRKKNRSDLIVTFKDDKVLKIVRTNAGSKDGGTACGLWMEEKGFSLTCKR